MVVRLLFVNLYGRSFLKNINLSKFVFYASRVSERTTPNPQELVDLFIVGLLPRPSSPSQRIYVLVKNNTFIFIELNLLNFSYPNLHGLRENA
jgi:hypothetical protein